MIKKISLSLALCGALVGAVLATPMAPGETRYFNFSRAAGGGVGGVVVYPSAAPSAGDTMSFEFFEGLNLTGNSLGVFTGDQSSHFFASPGFADGQFSLLARQLSGTPSLGDNNGDLVAMWLSSAGDYMGTTGAVAATDDRPAVVTPPTPSVPEPGSLLLASLAGLALMATRGRRPLAA